MPTGYFLGIFARAAPHSSGDSLVANGVGVIDPDYSGPTDEIMIQVLNITDDDVRVTAGDRLAQGIVLPAPRVTWEEVSDLRLTRAAGSGRPAGRAAARGRPP